MYSIWVFISEYMTAKSMLPLEGSGSYYIYIANVNFLYSGDVNMSNNIIQW